MAAIEPRTYCHCQDNCGCLLASHFMSPLTYCVNTWGPTRSSKIVATGRSAWDAHLPTVLWDAASPGRFAIELVTSMGRRITVTTDLTRHATSPSPHQPTPKRARPYNLVSHNPVAQPTPSALRGAPTWDYRSVPVPPPARQPPAVSSTADTRGTPPLPV
jgi:hypothetical protein